MKITMRGAPPAIVTRTYFCEDCQYRFSVHHHSADDPVPPCPVCTAEVHAAPGGFAITTNKSRAVDMAQQIAEEDYGMTDMNDNLREGDVAAKAPAPVQTAEAEAMVRELQSAFGNENVTPEHLMPQVQSFWKNAQTPPMPPEAQALKSSLEANAVASASVARQDGTDPVELLHKAGQAGKADPKYQVLGRAKLKP